MTILCIQEDITYSEACIWLWVIACKGNLNSTTPVESIG